MRRKSLTFALCAAILLQTVSYPALGADVLMEGQSAPREGIFFGMTDAIRILEDLESCRIVREENSILVDLDRNATESMRRYIGRIADLEQQQKDLLAINEERRKQSEQGEVWYRKIYKAGKWIAVGVLVGFALGASK